MFLNKLRKEWLPEPNHTVTINKTCYTLNDPINFPSGMDPKSKFRLISHHQASFSKFNCVSLTVTISLHAQTSVHIICMARPIYLLCHYYQLISAHCRYISVGVYVLWYVSILKLFLRLKNAWTSDLKRCNYSVCTVEGGLSSNNYQVKRLLFIALMFGIQVAKISCLHYISLSQVFDNHLQLILYI